MQSIWTPNTRWTEVTEEGFQGGPVVPSTYDGSAESLEQVRQNILKSGEVGRLVANDFRSSIIDVPLTEFDPETGERLSYQKFSADLENKIRAEFGGEGSPYQIYITGTPKKLGDPADGGAVSIALFLPGSHSDDLSFCCTCIPVAARYHQFPLLASLIAVVWQLGLYSACWVTPLILYSVLVPFPGIRHWYFPWRADY